MLPFLQSRATQINQEFAFLPSCPPRSQGGLFELRSYTLNPGKLLEWESAWYVLEAFLILYDVDTKYFSGGKALRLDEN